MVTKCSQVGANAKVLVCFTIHTPQPPLTQTGPTEPGQASYSPLLMEAQDTGSEVLAGEACEVP